MCILFNIRLFCPAYYDWSPWATCEKECGVEFHNRSRECVDPDAPFCIATETLQKRSCELLPCAGTITDRNSMN